MFGFGNKKEEPILNTIGWDSIDQKLTEVYPGQEPMHYATLIKYSVGGKDPIDGFNVYTAQDPTHWHYITYGFSELYEKASSDKENSGWGFEITFRLKKKESDTEPPKWVMNLIQNIAKYVFDTGNIFRDGDTMGANGPIALDEETDLTALLFITDPILGEIDTPNGKVIFLQMIGITEDELESKRDINKEFLLESLLQGEQVHISDLKRKSVVSTPEMKEKIMELQKTTPSSMGLMYIQKLDWNIKNGEIIIETGAYNVDSINKALIRRVKFGELCVLSAGDRTLKIELADSNNCKEEDGVLIISLKKETVSEISDVLKPLEGKYLFKTYPQLKITIVKTDITDSEGKVLETVG
jgi:hypothetical protein